MFGICDLSIIPCRKDASDTSEMVTQLLFGECYQILSEENKWTLIKTNYDNYTCWISANQVKKLSESFTQSILSKNTTVVTDILSVVQLNNEITSVVIGSNLPLYRAGKFNIEQFEYDYEGEINAATGNRKNIIEFAYNYLNAPYLWGGRTPLGIDCSGLSQMAYKLAGHVLPRDAYQQADLGITLSFIEEAAPGDLAFFDNEEGKIVHVGIILENQKIIHASGKVRIDTLDHFGIYNHEQKKYSHRLRILKTYI